MAKDIVEIPHTNEVAIKIEQNDFADLILNFLGKKEKIAYSKSDIEFKVTHNDIEQFYYLLDSKIKKESYTDISHFSTTIYYHDNTFREINGIKALNEFLETRDVIPEAIILSWNILLSFPDSITIENQKIDVVLSITEETDFVSITVEHTNPAWGKEVLSLLKEHTESLIVQRHPYLTVSYYLKNFLDVSIVAPIMMLILLIFLFWTKPMDGSLNTNQVSSMSKIIDIGKTTEVDSEIQLSFNMIKGKYSELEIINIIKNEEIKSILRKQILENKKESSQRIYQIFSLIGVVFGTIFLLLFLLKKYIKYYSEKSFILVTPRVEKIYDKYKDSKNKLEHYSLTFITFTIIIGLLVNTLYQFMVS